MSFALLFQKQNRDVARKLGIATVLMFTLPILAFYFCLEVVFADKDEPLMWAGGFAVLTANLVIAGYVTSAFSEEDDEQPSKGDAAGPKVGSFKMRTD